MKWQRFLLETTKQGNDEQAKKSDKVLRESKKKNENAREKGSNTSINVKHLNVEGDSVLSTSQTAVYEFSLYTYVCYKCKRMCH